MTDLVTKQHRLLFSSCILTKLVIDFKILHLKKTSFIIINLKNIIYNFIIIKTIKVNINALTEEGVDRRSIE